MWWILVILVIVLIGCLFAFGGSSNAVGYTRGHGHCPNMGACDNCDLCEGD